MLLVAAVIVGVYEVHQNASIGPIAQTTATAGKSSPTVTAPPVPPPSVHSALAPWRPLPIPISEALLLPGPDNKLLIVGGEVPDGTSGSGVFLMTTSTGALEQVANLEAGVHDASGATLGDEDYIFGGKAVLVTSTVQSFPAPSAPSAGSPTTKAPSSTATTTSVVAATATGALPEPRAGSAAVSIGTTVYIVGGYHGDSAQASVLATSDGGTFTTVARLPVAVRNAAVATAGGYIYVFGGEAWRAPVTAKVAHPTTTTLNFTSAPKTVTSHLALTWAPVADIQRVDPATGQATVVGRLPASLQGAVAVTINGNIYVAGGMGRAGVNGLIWGFEPADSGLTVAGHLKVPVAGAAAATVGSTAWLVGGESVGGHLVGSVQTFRPKATGSLPPPGPGSSRPKATASTSPAPKR